MPLVRRSVQPPQAIRMAATMEARLGPSASPRLTAAQAAKAMPRTGIARVGNMKPIIPVAIDLSMKRDAVYIATPIRTTAPQRSNRGAQPKNAHHAITATPPRSAPNIATAMASGQTEGRTNLNKASVTATKPSHGLNCFLEAMTAALAGFTAQITFRTVQLFHRTPPLVCTSSGGFGPPEPSTVIM